MNALLHIIAAHWMGISVTFYLLFIAHTQAMYPPTKEPSKYGYFYRFCLALVPLLPTPKIVKIPEAPATASGPKPGEKVVG